jgi:hypothetical protein
VPVLALSRAGSRAVELVDSETEVAGQGLGQDVWSRLEQVADPRSELGRIYPLSCLLAIAVCAFTAAGHDRLTAVGQWIAGPDSCHGVSDHPGAAVRGGGWFGVVRGRWCVAGR